MIERRKRDFYAKFKNLSFTLRKRVHFRTFSCYNIVIKEKYYKNLKTPIKINKIPEIIDQTLSGK